MNYSDKLALLREYKSQGGKGSYLSLLKTYEEGGEIKDPPKKATRPLQEWETANADGTINTNSRLLPNLPKENQFNPQSNWMNKWILNRGDQARDLAEAYDAQPWYKKPIKDAFNLQDAKVKGTSKIIGALNNLNTVNYKDNSKVDPQSYQDFAWGAYSPLGHSINFLLKTPSISTQVHEMGHATHLGNWNPSKHLIDKVKLEDATYNKVGNSIDGYYKHPDEIYSRIWELRKLLDLKPTDKVDPNMLLERKKNVPSRDYYDVEENKLWQMFTPESISRLLNDLVVNQPQKQPLYQAALGGNLPTYDGKGDSQLPTRNFTQEADNTQYVPQINGTVDVKNFPEFAGTLAPVTIKPSATPYRNDAVSRREDVQRVPINATNMRQYPISVQKEYFNQQVADRPDYEGVKNFANFAATGFGLAPMGILDDVVEGVVGLGGKYLLKSKSPIPIQNTVTEKAGFINPLELIDNLTPMPAPQQILTMGYPIGSRMSLSPANLIPGYGKVMKGENQLFRKFGNSMEDVINRQVLSPTGGSKLRVGREQIVGEGNWAAKGSFDEKYSGVFGARVDPTIEGSNLGSKIIGKREGELITDKVGNNLVDVPISDPGLSFHRRLPFSNKYVEINKQKLIDKKFQLATQLPHVQNLTEKYIVGLGFAKAAELLGFDKATEIYNKYTIDPINENVIQPSIKYIKDTYKNNKSK
jgi:hypothetical protein